MKASNYLRLLVAGTVGGITATSAAIFDEAAPEPVQLVPAPTVAASTAPTVRVSSVSFRV